MSHLRLLAGLLSTFSTTVALAANPSQTIELSGVVRDFQRAHPDFDVVPIGGPGHYAGNVAPAIGAGQRPSFAGSGFKVDTQWRNSGTDPIAPHLFAQGGVPGAVNVANAPDVNWNATEDTWDSSLGTYDSQVPGPAPTYNVGAPMPMITAPTGLGPSQGDVTLQDETLNTDLHCDDLDIDGTVQISGSVTILCEGDFEMTTHSRLELQPGSTLDLYAKGEIRFQPHSDFNAPPDTGMPGLAIVCHLGTEVIRVSQPQGVVYATVIAPASKMLIEPNAEFFGNVTAQDLDVQPNAGFHIDTNITVLTDACGVVINDLAGAAGLTSDGAISSDVTFDQWYTDILGVNLAKGHEITMVRDGFGVYEYLDNNFYPIDGQLFGNEGDAHNNFFTFTIEAHFEYEMCSGQFLEFAGADDAWIFVDGRLGIDLGGVSPGTEQVVEMDRMGLTDGQEYTIQLFYAHRGTGSAGFNLRTNMELWSNGVTVTANLPCD